MNQATAWTVHIRYQQERDRNYQRQNQKQDAPLTLVFRASIANQKIAADSNQCHQDPRAA